MRLAFLGIVLSTLLCTAAGCESKPDYPHATNFALGDDDTYVKNPEVKLKREYWIVVRAESGSHAMLPRPDGSSSIVDECTTKGPLAPLFEGASLCRSATQETLARINALTASEAMQTSTFLHQKLRFVAKEGPGELSGAHVEPFPLTDDLLDVCKTYPSDRNGALRSLCDEELRYENADARPAIGRRYSMEECQVIAARMNELYGIP